MSPINGLTIVSLSVSVSLSDIELHSDQVMFQHGLMSSPLTVSAHLKQSIVFLHNPKILGRPQKRIGALIKRGLRSAVWRIVMEQLDSVNVFILPVLKFKKWSPSLPPGCTLSCLKRSDYLLTVCRRGLGGFDHQLIPKRFYSSKLNSSFTDE